MPSFTCFSEVFLNNKPGGSIKIRVKTYAHSLTLHKERLEDMRGQKNAMLHQIDRKRLALLNMKREHLASEHSRPAMERQIEEIMARVRAYEAAREKPSRWSCVRTPRLR